MVKIDAPLQKDANFYTMHILQREGRAMIAGSDRRKGGTSSYNGLERRSLKDCTFQSEKEKVLQRSPDIPQIPPPQLCYKQN